MNYYIFSTLPLDVENIVIHPQCLEESVFEKSCVNVSALRMNVLYFLHAAARRRKYSNSSAEFEGGSKKIIALIVWTWYDVGG